MPIVNWCGINIPLSYKTFCLNFLSIMTRLSLSFISLSLLFTHCTRQPASNPRDFGGRPMAKAATLNPAQAGNNRPRRTEILFLGDNGHHKPVERVPQLMAALGNRGINITYTDRLEDLNSETLNKYDGLLIYANWDSIAKPQERALLDYVAAGHGIIPVHCASYCFRNSAEYVDKVVGGQFWRHKMDTIQTRFTQPNSPIVAGLPVFSAYDETYLHSHLQADNNVLAVRDIKADQKGDKPNTGEEPYTWTRQYGKGRVFYTAYGHDERTWSQPGFQQLLERGILWAVGDGVKQLHDNLNPQPFAYHEAKLPNYEKRPGPQLEQEPLSPEESMKHIQVPVDFTLELFAHEPNVMHPIAMAWDERGRLFVLITKDYPNERKPTGGSDSIVICEDTDHDGKADKFTTFAEGLSIPTGLVFANGGLYVSQAPDMLFFQDTDGDDKADVRKTVFTGFGTFDTHAGPSNLHYGLDNWIWGSVGYSGFKGKVNPQADSLDFGQAFFRFKPGVDGKETRLEWMTRTSNNTWGLGITETGDVFGSTANNSHGWYMAIPKRYFHGAEHLRENGSRGTDTHKDMKPITPKVRQVDVFGGFTAAAGHNFYTARAFPKAYWNKIAFVCEPTGHIVHQNLMQQNGTDFEDVEPIGTGFNLMAGADEWFAPVFAEVGPDGAVWVADWYSYIIQHNPTPKGFGNGTGNAYDTPLRDYTHGRLYRVAYKNGSAYAPMPLSKDHPQELVAALKNPNMFWRITAQRLLVERGNKDTVPQLVAMVTDQSVDEQGINPGAIHALRTLEGLTVLNEPGLFSVLKQALHHPDGHVRKTVMQVIPRTTESANALLDANMLADKEPLVLLNTLLALADMPQTTAVQQAVLSRLALAATETNDRWLPDAFACALTTNGGQLMKQYINLLAANALKQSKTTDVAVNQTANAVSADAHKQHQMMATNASSDKPDLVITNVITEPASPVVRENVRFGIEVTNQGGVALPKGTVVPLSIRIEGPGRKIDLVSYVFDAGLAPGESTVIRKNTNGPWTGDLQFAAEQAGDFKMAVMVDKNNAIAEANEQNNAFTHTLTYRAPASMSAFVLERASRSYASIAPVDSVVALLRQSQQLEANQSAAVVKGIAEGWNPKQKATVREADRSFLASLTNAVSGDNRDRLHRLYEAWGLASITPVDPNVTIIRLKTVREAMKYDQATFTVKAGKPVEIVLENPDAMQHNLVIGKPKSMEIIGAAADKLITAKDGAEKNYVPAIPQVLAATPLVNPGQSYRLTFTAPTQPGDYPFVCTFPGHWRIMNGVMQVR